MPNNCLRRKLIKKTRWIFRYEILVLKIKRKIKHKIKTNNGISNISGSLEEIAKEIKKLDKIKLFKSPLFTYIKKEKKALRIKKSEIVS